VRETAIKAVLRYLSDGATKVPPTCRAPCYRGLAERRHRSDHLAAMMRNVITAETLAAMEVVLPRALANG
jgi:hypothetical protein